MVRFLVLYQQPPDAGAFEKQYFGMHVPLAAWCPAIQSMLFELEDL